MTSKSVLALAVATLVLIPTAVSAESPPTHVKEWTFDYLNSLGFETGLLELGTAGSSTLIVGTLHEPGLLTLTPDGTPVALWHAPFSDRVEGVAGEPDGSVLTLDCGSGIVRHYSPSGSLLSSWNVGPPNAPGVEATDISVDPAGRIYVSMRDSVRVYLGDGTYSHTVHFALSENFQIAVDEDGNLYATRWTDVVKYASDGSVITSWGGSGTGPGQFNCPATPCLDGEGHIYVSDFINDRIEKFDTNGNFILEWGRTGSGPGELDYPASITMDSSGLLYVFEAMNTRIQVFDTKAPTPVHVTTWGNLKTRFK